MCSLPRDLDIQSQYANAKRSHTVDMPFVFRYYSCIECKWRYRDLNGRISRAKEFGLRLIGTSVMEETLLLARSYDRNCHSDLVIICGEEYVRVANKRGYSNMSFSNGMPLCWTIVNQLSVRMKSMEKSILVSNDGRMLRCSSSASVRKPYQDQCMRRKS